MKKQELDSMKIAHMKQIYKKIQDSKNIDHNEFKFWNANRLKYFEYLQNKKIDEEIKKYSKKHQIENSDKKINYKYTNRYKSNLPQPIRKNNFSEIVENIDYNKINTQDSKKIKLENFLKTPIGEGYKTLSKTIIKRLKKNEKIKEKLEKENKEIKEGYSLNLFPIKTLENSKKETITELPLVKGIPRRKMPPINRIEKTEIPPIIIDYLSFKKGKKISNKEYKKFEQDLISGQEYAETLIDSYLSGKINTKQYHNLKDKIIPTTRGKYLTEYFGELENLAKFEQKGLDYELKNSKNSWLQKKYLKNKKKQIKDSDLEKIIQKDWKNVAKGAFVATALLATTCFGTNSLMHSYDGQKTTEEIFRERYSISETIEEVGVVADSLDSYIQNPGTIRQKIAEINAQREQTNLVSQRWGDTGNSCLIHYFNDNHSGVDVYVAIEAFEQDNPGVNPNILMDNQKYNFRTNYSNIGFENAEERESFVEHIDEIQEEQFNTGYDVMRAQGYDPSITEDRKAFAEENLGGAINWVELIEETQEPNFTVNLENIVSGNVYTIAITNENNEVLSCKNVLAHDCNQGTASLNYYDLNIPDNENYQLLLFDKTKIVNSNNIEQILEMNNFEENDYLGAINLSEGDEINLNVSRRIDVGKIVLGPEPWADILINGEEYGRTPIRGVELPPGTYDVTFQRSENEITEYFSEDRTYTIDVKAGEITSIRYNNEFNPEGTEYSIDNILTDSTTIEPETKIEEPKELYEIPYDKIIENYNSNKRFKTVQKEFSDLEKTILIDTIKEGVENNSAYSKRFDKDYAKESGLIKDIKTMYENSVSYKSIKNHCKRHGMNISDSTIYRIGKNTV
ncbi:hypothetical protein ISS05_02760 [Candidatus Woesearchaeota archaeon]|nr:hypothetical protein [Candidatus Woesearchaeota archaeon]